MEHSLSPEELIKCKRKYANPFIGYRLASDSNKRFSTESLSIWHDRNLMDSLVMSEDELVKIKQ